MLRRRPKLTRFLCCLIFSLSLFTGCKKDEAARITEPDPVIPVPPAPVLPDLSTLVQSSVSGFVSNENGMVSGAEVKVGNVSTTTNQFGFFELRNVQVVKTAAFVSVYKPGYFKAFKTWGAVQGQDAFFRIVLLPKTVTGNIDAAAGGDLSLPNLTRITLPGGALVTANNNTPFTGTAQVAINYLDQENWTVDRMTPGDLRGLNSAGELKGLVTYGMVAVELTDGGGNLLQLASGRTATLTLPLSSQLIANAPDSIGLWSFNENNGLWQQESSSTRTGNIYRGEISHFSFWGCHIPTEIVPLNFSLVNANGSPITNLDFEISPVGPGWKGIIHGFSNNNGVANGFVAPNTGYELRIYSDCRISGEPPFYNQPFTSFQTAVSLGNIGNITNANYYLSNINGRLIDCNGAPVTSGHVTVLHYYTYTQYPVDNNGIFSFNMIGCSPTTPLEITGYDANADEVSLPFTFYAQMGPGNTGDIRSCGSDNNEFIHYTINGGAATHLAEPVDSVAQTDAQSNSFIVRGMSNGGQNWMQIEILNSNISLGSFQPMYQIWSNAFINGAASYTTTPPLIQITEYGPVGGFISGNFVATLVSGVPTTYYNVDVSFRVRRVY